MKQTNRNFPSVSLLKDVDQTGVCCAFKSCTHAGSRLSHMSLSVGGVCVTLHISTREPSFSCRLGL